MIDQTEIVPGIRMIDTPGHTMGHMAVMVESDGQQLLVVGDAISHVYASFEHPGWHFGFDADILNDAVNDDNREAMYHRFNIKFDFIASQPVDRVVADRQRFPQAEKLICSPSRQ